MGRNMLHGIYWTIDRLLARYRTGLRPQRFTTLLEGGMNIKGERLPLLDNPAQFLDIWRMNNGVAITMSDKDGEIHASAWFTKEQWRHIVSYMEKLHDDP